MHRLYIHPLPVRIWHWTNAVGFVLMILTGMQIRYVGLIDVVSFRTAVSVHNFVGFVLIANFFLWFLFYHLFRPDQGLSFGTEPAEAFRRRLPANVLLRLRHLQG